MAGISKNRRTDRTTEPDGLTICFKTDWRFGDFRTNTEPSPNQSKNAG